MTIAILKENQKYGIKKIPLISRFLPHALTAERVG
jgi:hypothetical protein